MHRIPTLTQISAGGVAFRPSGSHIEVVLISVGAQSRWQLPKGLVDQNEPTEIAAMREVREEAGIETEMIGPIDVAEYWYISTERDKRVRFHKFVHFYLLRYVSGDTSNHDHEVNEARWVSIDEAHKMLAFSGEKRIVEKAIKLIQSLA